MSSSQKGLRQVALFAMRWGRSPAIARTGLRNNNDAVLARCLSSRNSSYSCDPSRAVITSTTPKTRCRHGTRNFVTASSPAMEKRTIKVPTMGDSITEGTIVEWNAQVGSAVNEGDVVAMVETDKVTIEIKAEIGGTVTNHFGAVDDTIEVGGDLYEIDTDAAAASAEATGTTTTTESSSDDASPPPAPAQEEVPAATSSGGSQHRTPSIQFLGKEGWQRLRNGHKLEEDDAASAAAASNGEMAAPPSVVVREVSADASTQQQEQQNQVHPMYGRLPFSEEEMEALILGGASLAPELLKPSHGAKFKPSK